MVKRNNILTVLTVVPALLFLLGGAIFPSQMGRMMQEILDFISVKFGWLYLLAVLCFVFFCLWLALSKYGEIKLGSPDDKPEYSYMSWIAMLFSAGMGIGLVFWSVGEPLSHLAAPLRGEPYTEQAVLDSMRYTFFHWGIHPWAVYGLTGLALAFFAFKKQLPLLISSTLEPVLGKGINGWLGKSADGLAVFATIFGVATSLGLGTLQINSGLKFLFGVPETKWVSVLIIIAITFLFTLSAVTGIKRGIKVLSNMNLFLAFLLLIFMFVVGPGIFNINLIITTIGNYIQSFFSMSLNTDPVRQSGWINSWTVFYWAWWIAWAPFVGGFIARISKGRTIREFVFGVLLAPTVLSFLWMGTFGGTSLYLQQMLGKNIAPLVAENVASGLFLVFQHYPLTDILSGLALLLVAIFFITSADSATFVVSMLISGGGLEPANNTKVLWGVIQGGVAIVLLLAGGLNALQAASIIAAFPFMLIMIAMAYCLVRELNRG
ncbi:MAG: glycine betaine uptake BCCT transporter [Bacillota bacterium]